jgi:hypothetical protein
MGTLTPPALRIQPQLPSLLSETAGGVGKAVGPPTRQVTAEAGTPHSASQILASTGAPASFGPLG